jgi:hypothetical protein
MSSSMMLLILARMAAMALTMQVGLASTSAGPRQESIEGQFRTEPTRTGKERLGGKASDQQRVDNCKVPLDQRGSTPRPGDCGDGTSTPPRRR